MIQRLWLSLGGRDAVSPLPWLIAFPIALIGVTVALTGNVDAPLEELLLVSFLSYGATAIVYLIAYFSFLNPDPERASRPVLALTTHLLAQVSASAVLLLYLPQQELGWNLVWGRLLIGVFWALVLSMIFQARMQFLRDSKELVAAITAAEDDVEDYELQIAQARSELVDKVRGLLAQMLSLRSPDELPEATTAIRPILDHIRQQDAIPKRPELESFRIPALQVLGNAVSSPVSPLAIALVATALLPIATLQNLTWPLVLNYIPLATTIFLAFWYGKRYSRQRPTIFVVYGMGVVASLMTAAVISWAFSVERLSLFALNLRTWLVALAMGLLINYYSEQLRLIERLREARELLDWQVARSRQLLWAERLKLATSIHGDVQSKIIASIASAKDLNSLDLEALKSDCLDSLDKGLEKSFSQFWEQTVRLWGDAIEINLVQTEEVSEALRSDSVANTATIEVVREAILNAVRHGSATRVEVRIEIQRMPAGSVILVEVLNNGAAVSGDVVSGFGSEVISEATTRWSLQNKPQGVVLTARIPQSGSSADHGEAVESLTDSTSVDALS